MLDFKIKKFLGSIFTPDFSISNSLNIANVAVEIAGDRLDGPPSILPIPQDAPAEIPRIQLFSSDKNMNITISLQRTNLNVQLPLLSKSEIDINDCLTSVSYTHLRAHET